MRHVRMLGLCLVAVFALGALVASAAQAETTPEFGRCVKLAKSKGKYLNSNCTERSEKVKVKKGKEEVTLEEKGGYEWLGGTAVQCYNTKGKTGNYTEAECKTEAGKTKHGKFEPDHKGAYEKTAGGNKFTGAGGAGVLRMNLTECTRENGEPDVGRVPKSECTDEGSHEGWWNNTANSVECESEHATGEAVGSDTVANVSVRFAGCTAFGLPATTAGLPAGEIQVNPLKGRLGYIEGKGTSTPDVGVLLEPATAGGKFTEFEIGEGEGLITVGVGNAVEGSFYETDGHAGVQTGNDGLISPITPVNRMSHTFAQDYRAEQIEYECPYPVVENCQNNKISPEKEYRVFDYLNVPSKFEGGQRESLEGNLVLESQLYTEWGPAGQEINNVNTVEGEAEIKA